MMPIVQKETVIAYLKTRFPKSPRVETSGIYPSDDSVVNHGVYVDDMTTVGRVPYNNSVTYGGAIYTKEDTFNVLFVTFQEDKQSDAVQAVIENLANDSVFWDGYHEVNYSRVTQVGNRSEKHTYTFTLKRLDFNA